MRVVLQVKHFGKPKMVGKVFPVHGEDIFYHEATVTQEHNNLDSPGGLDEVVLAWLSAAGITQVHHWTKPGGPLWMTTVSAIIEFGIEQHAGGRHRIYLPRPMWRSRKERLYAVPHVTDIKILDPMPQLYEGVLSGR